MRLNPYLSFDGNCREAFEFYASVLGGQIEAMLTYASAPPQPEGTQPPEGCATPDMMAGMRDKIMHARMQVGGVALMASDAPHGMYQKPTGTNVTLNIDSPAEADRIFAALAEGGTTIMPIGETFWARRFGMVVDRFGTPWMINCEKPMAASRAA